MTLDPERDLEITRIIKAPRSAVWDAWTKPEQFAKWWVPEPETCRIVAMDLRPGGAMQTEIAAGPGETFGPHMSACYLDVVDGRRIVFTNALVGGWRPAEQPFITAIITLDDHDLGTAYRAVVMHKSPEDRQTHHDLGFYDGWGTVAAQLAKLVEQS
ncbi:SRPBCC family protein [Devosia sp. SL43]|uniref:SRPBCC family protein n=1 Tax=Devosia sp. SL43 TaxID=2806348 RepID=UPI001F2908B9|nr:SRPBCC family protein [Devosia sp. SL43]UJW85139.1 SRPBCC family protein [Devosia sp. SL43]